NDDFEECIHEIFNDNEGRVIVTGIGKSAIIAQKMVATFNSTGTPAIFMHAADAVHGDLGIIQAHDIVICLSKSGNTPEIKLLMPMIQMMGNKIIAIVGNINSYLAKHADYTINCTVDKESCPNNLAPTTSSTAQLVIGNVMAACLISMRGFSDTDFARIHPGGVLGKKLYLKVETLCKQNEKPQVNPSDNLNTIIYEISSKRLGVTAVINNNKIVGIITDGDLRRMLQSSQNIQNIKAEDIMSRAPKLINENEMAVKSLEIMRINNITSLLVINDNKEYVGVVHLHDIIREGII
ncbi:MAG: KpsF/GutQ family sugar-phosphate isomerase, partial [Bacteroidales bacterium]|nr:KpsF/GutQ family sugar-phosphate isomerase [Bacteroidales bacterium]